MEDESAEQTDTRIKKLWEKLDVRKEGFLDIAALKAGFKKLDHPLQRASDDLVADILRVADIDGDGRIQYDGILERPILYKENSVGSDTCLDFRRFLGETESTLRSLFKRIDHDNDGRLDKNELRQAFSLAGVRVPDSKLEDFFANVDTNNDGAITFNEWRSVGRQVKRLIVRMTDLIHAQRLPPLPTTTLDRSKGRHVVLSIDIKGQCRGRCIAQ